MNPLRRQLPVLSPLTLRAVAAAITGHDARPDVIGRIRRLFEADVVILTDSGTSALTLALQIAGERRRHGVCALPAFGCYDLATAALAAGAKVVLYDIDPRTLTPIPASIELAMSDRCAAVVVVHHYGVPVPMQQIHRLAEATGSIVIEDAAQAAGAFIGDRRVGANSAATVLSFGRGKGVTAGSGGALLLSESISDGRGPILGDRLPPDSAGVSFIAKLAAQWLLARPAVYGLPARIPLLRLGETIYREPAAVRSMSSRATNVLKHTLPSMDADAERRRENATRLRAVQAQVAPETLIVTADHVRPGWLRLPVMAPRQAVPRALASPLLGIVRAYPTSLDRLAELRPSLVGVTNVPGATLLSERLWTLPTHRALQEQDLIALEQWIQKI